MHSSEETLLTPRSEWTSPRQASPDLRRFCRPFIFIALILDLLPAVLHLLCFYLNMTLDYAQEHILIFLNAFSSAAAIVTIPIFIGSIILRCRFIRREFNPGASLIITAPSFIISILPLLLSISLLADLIGI